MRLVEDDEDDDGSVAMFVGACLDDQELRAMRAWKVYVYRSSCICSSMKPQTSKKVQVVHSVKGTDDLDPFKGDPDLSILLLVIVSGQSISFRPFSSLSRVWIRPVV